MSYQVFNNLIGGEWLPAKSGKTFFNLNPADRTDVVGSFPASSAEDVDLAVAAAKKAFVTWRLVPAPKRAERLPGLTDPNAPAPAPAQPGQPQTAPVTPPAPKLLHPAHPDRFSPGSAPEDTPDQPVQGQPDPAKPKSEAPAKPAPKTSPQRNP